MESIDNLDDERLHQTSPEEPAAPVVVIEYRHHGLLHRLMPAALVLLAAIAISSYQRKTPVRLIPNRALLVAAKPAAEVKTAPVVALFSNAISPEHVADVAKPTPEIIPSLFELNPKDGLVMVPADPANPGTFFTDETEPAEIAEETPTEPEALPEPIVDVPAPAQAEPTGEDIRRDIDREAKEKEAEERRVADLKPQAEAMMREESAATVKANRALFHKDLRVLVKSKDKDIFQLVDNLCNQYGRSLSEELKARYYRAQRSFPSRMSRTDQVLAMRKLGLPEPMILDFLVNKTLKTARSGPAGESEAVMLAARQLLAIPLSTPVQTSAKAKTP